MEQLDEVRVGIVGAGLLGNVHLMSLETIAEGAYFGPEVTVEVTAVCDTDEGHLREYQALHEIPHAVTDYRALLALDEVNTVFIATPTVYHKEIFLAAARAGKHVFCEKPLAFTLADIDEMIAARDAAGIHAQVGFCLRAHPGFWYTRQLVRDPARRARFGRLMNVTFHADQTRPYTGTGIHPSTWRGNEALAHAGTLFEHSIHDFDVLRYWFGDFTEIYARVKYFFGVEHIEDSAAVIAEMANGATVSLTAVWHDVKRDARHVDVFWENAHLEIQYAGLGYRGTLEVAGEGSTALEPAPMETAYRAAIGFADKPPMWIRNYGYEALLFVAALVDGQPRHPLVAGLEQSRRAHEIVEACYQSSRTRAPVALDPAAG